MPGLLSVFSFEPGWPLYVYAKYGLLTLQNRGEEKKILCMNANSGVECRDLYEWSSTKNISNGFIAGVFNSVDLDGYIYWNDKLAVITDRRFKEISELADSIEKLISEDALWRSIEKVLSDFNGKEIPSFIAITKNGDEVIYRSPLGLTPLSIGGYGFDLLIASSESSTIEVLDADVRRYLKPGEGVVVSRNYLRFFQVERSRIWKICAFELLYTSRHDSLIDGIGVYEFRKTLGARLSRQLQSENIDIVLGVPETAIPYAIGLAQASGKPFEQAFIPTPVRSRSMLKNNPLERLIAIHLKLNPVKSVLGGKRVAVVDDSMVTGATLKSVSQILRNRVGVRELHLFIASPKIIKECPYRIFEFNKDCLISANLDDELLRKYLEVDSVNWLDLESLNDVARMYNCKLCGSCFGREVLGVDQ